MLKVYDSGAYTRLQFLRAVSHSVGAHSNRLCDAYDDSSDVDDDDDADRADVVDVDSQTDSQVDTPETDNDNCGVCLIAPRNPRNVFAYGLSAYSSLINYVAGFLTFSLIV